MVFSKWVPCSRSTLMRSMAPPTDVPIGLAAAAVPLELDSAAVVIDGALDPVAGVGALVDDLAAIGAAADGKTVETGYGYGTMV